MTALSAALATQRARIAAARQEPRTDRVMSVPPVANSAGDSSSAVFWGRE